MICGCGDQVLYLLRFSRGLLKHDYWGWYDFEVVAQILQNDRSNQIWQTSNRALRLGQYSEKITPIGELTEDQRAKNSM